MSEPGSDVAVAAAAVVVAATEPDALSAPIEEGPADGPARDCAHAMENLAIADEQQQQQGPSSTARAEARRRRRRRKPPKQPAAAIEGATSAAGEPTTDLDASTNLNASTNIDSCSRRLNSGQPSQRRPFPPTNRARPNVQNTQKSTQPTTAVQQEAVKTIENHQQTSHSRSAAMTVAGGSADATANTSPNSGDVTSFTANVNGGPPSRSSGVLPYCTLDEFDSTENLEKKLLEGELIQGTLRINPRNSDDAFVSLPNDADGGIHQWDIYIAGLKGRGRALNGDIVAVKLLPRDQWKVRVEAIRQWEFDHGISLADSLRRSGDSSENATANDAEQDTGCLTAKSSRNHDDFSASGVVDNVDGKSDDELDAAGTATASAGPAVNVTAETSDATKNSYTDVNAILEHPEWGRFVQRTGKVIGVLSDSGPKVACGSLKLMPFSAWHSVAKQQQQRKARAAMFVPQDRRFPRLWIPGEQCPNNFFQRSADYSDTLFCARLECWPTANDPGGHWEMPRGKLLELVGRSGDIEAETWGILMSQMIDSDEYTDDILEDLPMRVQPEWKIPNEELESRRDFRNQLVVSIDPSTARDIDDALSVRQIENDLYEVSVHIADLSYFIPPGCKLDKKAEQRATSVYLVQRVIPMLPRILCNNLCSLSAGADKLTFSVVWTMNSKGEVLDEWFGRTVIRSCCQLSYEDAQQMIDDPNRDWTQASDLPSIHGDWSISDISKAVNILNAMAVKMRARRVANGCLRLDQIRLQFALTDDGSTPQGFSVYMHSASHQLIEEFMLQANMAVAHRLIKYYPELAFLRNHPPPDWRRLEDTLRVCAMQRLTMTGKTSGQLQKSLSDISDSSNRLQVVDEISNRLGCSDEISRSALLSALSNVLSKPFKPAAYFVAGSVENADCYRHFALAVPLYTHFTSPIRRYADLIVHRLLTASLDLTTCPYTQVAQLQRVAAHCNQKKYAAKAAQEASVELYVWAFISNLPESKMDDKFLVVAAFDKAVDVMSLTTGIIHRAYVDQQGCRKSRFTNDPDCLILVYDSSRGSDQSEELQLKPLAPVRGTVFAQSMTAKYLIKLSPPPNAILVNCDKPQASSGNLPPQSNWSKPNAGPNMGRDKIRH